MADNTTRPSGSGGDVIRSEDEGSQKTQVFKFDPRILPVSNVSAGLLAQLRDAKAGRLELLRSMMLASRRQAAAMPPQAPQFPAAPAGQTIQDILGSRLYRWYRDYTLGTYACVLSSGDATQTTSANQPAVGTFSGGNSYADFDGTGLSDADTLTSSTIGTVPTYSSSDAFLAGLAVRLDTQPKDPGWIWKTDASDSIGVHNGGFLVFCGSFDGDSDIRGTGWRRVIMHKKASDNVLYAFVDGVQQTNTAAAGTLGANWKTSSFAFGDDFGGAGGSCYDGGAACLFWARDTVDFTSGDIAALDTALQNFIS